MFHIITTFFGRDDWFTIQANHLKKYSSEPYTCYAALDERLKSLNVIREQYPNHIFGRVAEGEHWEQVNAMTNSVVLEMMDDDDILVFLDCDAFPCDKEWQKTVRENLSTHDITAVVMRENYHMEDRYMDVPHLCFFATTKKTWQENNLQWNIVSPITGESYHNPQMGMRDAIRAAGLTVKELNRTNEFNAHRVCFGVYGDIVYHHACGVRGFEGKVDEGADVYIRKRKYGLKYEGNSDMARVNFDIWMSVWWAIQSDPTCSFVRRYFMGRP